MVTTKQEIFPLPISPYFAAGVSEVVGDLACSVRLSGPVICPFLWLPQIFGLLEHYRYFKEQPISAQFSPSTKENAAYKRRKLREESADVLIVGLFHFNLEYRKRLGERFLHYVDLQWASLDMCG